MKEKYESLALADLKGIAKARGLKGTSSMKKAELIELMLAEDEKDKAKAEEKSIQSKSISSAAREGAAKANRREETGKAEGKPERGEKPLRTEKTGAERKSDRAGSERPERTAQAENRGERPGQERTEYKTDRPEGRVEEPRTDDERFPAELDSGIAAHGILEVMPDGYGFIR